MDFLCNHEKIYEFGLVIGISTDSDDRLGMIENVECPKEPSSNDIRKNVEKELLQYAKNLKEQEYHIYSAKRAQNKEGTSQSLWCWKKQGRIHEIEIPRHECYIKEIEILEETINRPGQMSVKDFINKTICDLKTNRKNLIDFDIDKIIDNWSNFEHPVKQLEDLKIINVRVRVTTGTFIRQICRDLIRKTGIPMLCSYIDRKCVILNNE
jgi:tRNA U55 pseudouridine synthase TruB